MILFDESKSKCEICEKKDFIFDNNSNNNFIFIDDLSLNLCLECNKKYENNICLKCNKLILDKDFVSDCFCKDCFENISE